MNIKTTTVGIAARVIYFEHIDFYAFSDEFRAFIDDNPGFLSLPVYIQFNKKIEASIPEMSVFIDSLKDMDVFISGIISENKGALRFASQLAIPHFSSLEFITQTQSKPQQHGYQKATHDQAPEILQVSDQDRQVLTGSQDKQEAEYRKLGENLYKPTNDTETTQSPVSSDVQAPAPKVKPAPTPIPKMDPYENQGLTQPDQKPLIVEENVTIGQTIKHDGDILVFGKIACGAIVSATGSIHCYSLADGVLLAGSSGNNKARIYALKLNAESVAIAGYYAKYHQYKHILNQSNLMISLNKSELNFNAIGKLPEVIDVFSILEKEESPEIKKEDVITSLKEKEDAKLGVDFSSIEEDLNQSTEIDETNPQSMSNLFDNSHSSSALSSLEEIDDEPTESKTHSSSQFAEKLKQSRSANGGITPPLGS